MNPISSGLLSALLLLTAVVQGWLGVYLDEDSEVPRVVECVPGSPAEAAGLRPGDVILAIDGEALATRAALTAAIRSKPAGQEIVLRIDRNGSEKTLNVTLAEVPPAGGVPPEPAAPTPSLRPGRVPPGPAAAPAAEPSSGRPFLGIAVVQQAAGLTVARVLDNSPARRAGFERGDVLLRVGERTLRASSGLDEVLATARAGSKCTFVVQRGDAERSLEVQFGGSGSGEANSPESVPDSSASRRAAAEGRAPILDDYDAAMTAAEASGLDVLVVYGRQKSGPSQAQRRALEAEGVLEALSGFVVVYVDIDKERELSAAHKVETVPTVEIQKKGKVVWQHAGYLPPEALRKALRSEPQARTRRPQRAAAPDTAPDAASASPEIAGSAAEVRDEIARLRAEVEALRAELEKLRGERRPSRRQ
jgi:membrane-associated protease RseP (regulator of RpoE activity)